MEEPCRAARSKVGSILQDGLNSILFKDTSRAGRTLIVVPNSVLSLLSMAYGYNP